MKTIAFFNNKSGVGKTSLVYHLAWMYSQLGLRTVAVDLDPQANLSSMFLDDDVLERLWTPQRQRRTVYGAIQPLLDGTGDVSAPHLEHVTSGLGLLVGDLRLSLAEEDLSSRWSPCMDGDGRAFRVLSALRRVSSMAAQTFGSDLVLVDVGPNLGAFNRAAMITTDSVVVPLAPDLYSLEGLSNLGPTLRNWRSQWAERRDRNPIADLDVPRGDMDPIGYVVMQHALRLDRPVTAHARWMNRIPSEYAEAVLGRSAEADLTIASDPHCLATLKHYRSLMPLAQEARKPMFMLRPADGAIGSHAKAVQDCYAEFRTLAGAIASRSGVASS